MEVVKAFTTNGLHTEILIKGTIEDPIFRASDIGEILEITNIRNITKDFNNTEKIIQKYTTPGGMQDVTFLTEKGLYKVLFKSRKPIAETFQNWVCDIIHELRINGTYSLKQELEQKNKELENKNTQLLQVKEESSTQRHKILLREFGDVGNIVYIIRVKTFENGNYVIKIGQSRNGIRKRYQEHQTKFEEAYILDCYLVQQSKNFENYLHTHSNIKRAQFTSLPGHENERELFLISPEFTYEYLQNIISQNIKRFMQPENDELQKMREENDFLRKENELLKIEQPIKNIEKILFDLIEQNNQLKKQIEILTPISQNINTIKNTQITILDKINSSTPQTSQMPQLKTTTGFGEELPTLGARLQKIDPSTLKIIKVYDSVAEALLENPNLKRPSISKAVENNTVYQGYRWLFLDRNLPPDTVPNIPPTKITQVQNNGYIAKLNEQKTEILNVYLDKKTAAQENGLSPSGLDKPVKNFTMQNGYFYCLYQNCDEELRKQFEDKIGGEKVILYKDGVGQYDENGTLIREFTSKLDCYETLKISDKTLQKCLDKNVVYNGYKYGYLKNKLFI